LSAKPSPDADAADAAAIGASRAGRLTAAAVGLALAATHLPDGPFVRAAAAVALAALLASTLPRHAGRRWPVPLAVVSLTALAALPGRLAASPGLLPIALGLATAAAVLALGAAPAPPGRLPAGAWLRRHAPALALALLLGAVLLGAAFVARALGPDSLRLSQEWAGPYGLLLGALPVLLLAAVGLLAWSAFGPRPEGRA
jgi:hypothetical protein